MHNQFVTHLLSDWPEELSSVLVGNKSLCIAIFSESRELLFANEPMQAFLRPDAAGSLINPTFEKLLSFKSGNSLIFEGYLTLGDIVSVNPSIWAQVYNKDGKILIAGGAEIHHLLEQNQTLHIMNREVGDLQRQLLKEKYTLQKTLFELNDTNSELKAVNATKEKFFSIIAHDLRSPFNGFLALTQILVANIQSLAPEMLEEAVIRMNRSAVNLYTLLENLLAWSSIQQGKFALVKEKIVVRQLAEDCVALMNETALKKDIVLVNHVEKDVEVFADSNMLRTIIRNLLSNAIKYTLPGGKVQIDASPAQGNMTTLSISDTGIGMNQKIMDALFSMDSCKSQPGTAGEASTGLGLLLCMEFVSKMGGTIQVQSEVGKGSTFSVALPAAES